MKTVLLAFALFVPWALGQQPAPGGPQSIKIDPAAAALTPLQRANLRIAQLEFFSAKKDLESALRDFDEACAAAKNENRWPQGTVCRLQDLAVIPPEPAAGPGPPAKPAAAGAKK